MQFELKSLIFKKKANCGLEDDPFLKDLLEYINFENFKEKLVYKRSQDIGNNGVENKFSSEIENFLEILDFVLS